MKSIRSLSRLALVLAAAPGFLAATAQAANWYVDNNPGVPALPGRFTTLAAAHAAAANDDTIYIAGSATPYAGMTLTKRLYLVGVGYHLTNNSIPSANNNPATIGDPLTINSAGSTLTGLVVVSTNSTLASLVINGNNVVVSRCRFKGNSAVIDPVPALNASGLQIRQCHLIGQSWGFGSSATGCVISNSLVDVMGFLVRGVNNTITQCAFYQPPATSSNITVANTCSVSNSLFLIEGSGNVVNSGSVINCLSLKNDLPAGNGNINNATLASVIENNSSPDMKFALAAGSPALGAGTGGADMGAFGGPTPYLMSGLPPRPRLKVLTSGGISSTSSGLRVHVEAESKN